MRRRVSPGRPCRLPPKRHGSIAAYVALGVDCRGQPRAGWLTAEQAQAQQLLVDECGCFGLTEAPIRYQAWVASNLPCLRQLESGRLVLPRIREALFDAATERIVKSERLESCCADHNTAP